MKTTKTSEQLAPRFWRYGKALLGLRRDDVWLASFPRAGSTWMRTILCNMIALSDLDGRDVDYHLVGSLMPSFGRSNLMQRWQFSALPRFVKTHQSYRRLLFAVPRRAVYILRDPRDVMVSYYHYHQNLKATRFHGSFSELLRDERNGLSACLAHYGSWLPHCKFVIRYDDLLQDTAAVMQRMLNALQIPVEADLLRQAVERSNFKKMRKIQENTGAPRPDRLLDVRQPVARKGKSEQWPQYFSGEDLAFYQQLCHQHNFGLYTDGRSEQGAPEARVENRDSG